MTANEAFGQSCDCPSILLASNSERLGISLHKALQAHGFEVDFAGDYSAVDQHLNRRQFDIVLLEVTGEHAVEPAVQAALRVKRANAGQFVGYLADSSLDASGLAGDGIFPRSTTKLAGVLRNLLAGDEAGDGPDASAAGRP